MSKLKIKLIKNPKMHLFTKIQEMNFISCNLLLFICLRTRVPSEPIIKLIFQRVFNETGAKVLDLRTYYVL